MIPEVLLVERRKWLSSITHEAIGSVCIHGQEEWNEEMVSVPESFERLFSDLCMCSRVHHEHTKEHDMACYSTCLIVMNLNSSLWPHLRTFHIIEAIPVSLVQVIS